MIVRNCILWFVLLAFSTGAWAQGMSPSPPASQRPGPGAEATALAYRQLGLAVDELFKEQGEALHALQRRISEMDAYLKACGDKPGCTTPAEGGRK